ncbi:metallophosphoesterase [Flexithrix dorotheae]|uniref:metallophosphoesterase n=1 Tax=Flexithrix dorotheae TaxID=70993 RepID=UPI001B7FAA15|nr:metallophosphoesterase [Flexithrix dorotheae]
MKPFVLFVFLLFYSCSPKGPYYNNQAKNWKSSAPKENDIYHTVFLIGDAGYARENPLEPTFQLLKSQMDDVEEKGSILFLGDNIYPKGLPEETHPDRSEAEQRIKTQLELVKNFKGKKFFVPGNHDWAKGGKTGWQRVKYQEEFVENYLEDSDGETFLPNDGCPGPELIEISEDIILILIDTQWWLHYNEKPGEDSGCEASDKDQFLVQLNDLVKQHEDKKIIVAGHHPFYSNGLHGGHAPLKNHLFPLTEYKKNLYFPLPFIGTAAVLYRTKFGDIQDIPHPNYQSLKDNLESIFNAHPNLIYVAGHDHSLQYLPQGNTHYIVSGAGSKETFVKHKPKAQFAYAKKGFSRIDFHESGDVWLSFYNPNEDGSAGDLIFRTKLMVQPKPLQKPNEEYSNIDFSGKKLEKAATKMLTAGKVKKFFFGENYRTEWAQEINNVPVFDIGKEHGGLEILKRGGGMQTISLRMEAENEKQYVLRSIQKYPEAAVPIELRGTLAADVVEDQISGSHPYGALVIPALANPLGVYHTNPQLVYLPDDPRFRIYREDYKDGLYLYEERPDDDWRDADFFGNSKKIESTAKTIKKTREDNDDIIDQKHVLKSRIFDLWIGDWDRHEDQWRWATFEDKEKGIKMYQPIPRDRDQAFFNADGLVMAVGTRKWGMRKFQGFKHEIRDPAGMGFNARYFDRSFLTEPDLQDWMEEVEKIQEIMTDSIIEAAIKGFPPEIYQHSGEEIISKLKSRRDGLKESSKLLYLSLAKEVNVLGSDKHELFKVERLDDEKTRVRVWKIKKDGERKHKMYDRVFLKNETKEIRLYGFDGEDRFELEGEVNKGIIVRIIGGKDFDRITNKSNVKGIWDHTYIYDKKDKNEIEFGKDSRNELSNKSEVNEYNREEFQYNFFGPLAYFNFNPDDGLFIGAGFLSKSYGFRKDPFKQKHQVRGNWAPKTNSFNLQYDGEFIELLGSLDLVLLADFKSPSFVDFFYGLGNETKNEIEEKGKRYYAVRYNQIEFFPSLRKRWLEDKIELSIGGYYRSIELRDERDEFPNRYLYNEYIETVGEEAANNILGKQKSYLGAYTNLEMDFRDNEHLPFRGFYFNLVGGSIRETENEEGTPNEINYEHLRANLALYLGVGHRFRTVYATRVGTAWNFGSYQDIYQSNKLGGLRNLRGHRRMRFSGDKSFYWNNDIRFKLFNLRSLIINAQVGINGFYDLGRVWVDNDPSTENGSSIKWHNGKGVGLWMAPFDKTVIAFDFSFSEEESWLPFLRFGFLF